MQKIRKTSFQRVNSYIKAIQDCWSKKKKKNSNNTNKNRKKCTEEPDKTTKK